MLALLSLWSHLLAAAMYGALAILQLRRSKADPLFRPLVTAFAVVSIWSIFLALLDPNHLFTRLAESGRNLTFLAFMYGVLQSAGGGQAQRAVKSVYAAVAAVVGLQIVTGGVAYEYRAFAPIFEPLVATSQILGLTIAAGALILIHNLYGQATPASRSALKLPMLALAAMWGYDLHLYTVDHFTLGAADNLFALRGALLAMLVPLFALGLRSTSSWRLQVSRAATFQSLSLIGIVAYLLVMMSASRATQVFGGDWGSAVQLAIVALITAVALILLVSLKARDWLRVIVTKHLFEHRYDYRAEWLRFTDTLGRESDAPLEVRVVKALADIAGSPAGLLLTADRQFRLSPSAAWNWKDRAIETGDGAEALGRHMEKAAHILDFDAVRTEAILGDGEVIPVPGWLAKFDRAWAGIPLIHAEQLVGIVILEPPLIRRPLDWEDFDLFRAAGIQAASYFAEARGQQALADARRFDEFNRRFAFILHDIKNLVSQLSLVARNAERHAANPEFRADMVATLQASVKKLNDLLARLSPGAAREAEPVRPVDVGAIVEAVVAPKLRAHPIEASGDAGRYAYAGRRGLEQALVHLVQNAIEASPPGSPVEMRWFESGGDIAIEIADSGEGMSEEFVSTRLFQPFVSTKESGFGIGAYEARALVNAMGGRLDVETSPGAGARFTIYLPSTEAQPPLSLERMRA